VLVADAAMVVEACGPGFVEHFGCDVTGRAFAQLISNKDRRGRKDFVRATTAYTGGYVDTTLVLELGGARHCRVRASLNEHRWHLFVEDLLRFEGDAFSALTESAEKWSAAIGQSDDGIAILDDAHRIVEFNERFLTLGAFVSSFGVALNEESITGRVLFDLVDQEPTLEEMRQLIGDSRSDKRKRFRGVFRRGGLWLQATTSAIHLPVRGFVGTCVILKDITAHRMLEVASRELESKNADIQAMLQNLKQGVFTIVDDAVIHAEYSRHLEVLLGEADLAGRPAIPLLLDEAEMTSDERSMVAAAIRTTLGSDSLMFEINAHLLPREMRRTAHDGDVRELELDWVPLEDASGVVQRLLVAVRDVTEVRTLEKERHRQSEELALIAELVQVPGADFREFESLARSILKSVRRDLNSEQLDVPTVERIFRNYHGLKGNSRFRGLRMMSASAHDAEAGMDAVRRQPDAPWDAQAHLQDLEAIERMLARYRHVNDEVLGRGDAFGEVVAGSLVLAPDELSEFFERARSASEDLSRTSALMDGLRERAALGVDEMLSTVIRGLPTVAKAVDKPDPVVFIDGGDVGFDPTIANAMRDLFIHLLTNAIDHGVDDADARRSRGLEPAGHIRVDVEQAPGGAVDVLVSDDGPGLRLDLMRARLEEPGMTDAEVAELIFRSGCSTKECVTPTSGRGVGLDAARGLARSFDAKLDVEFTDGWSGASMRLERTIRFRLRVPAGRVWREREPRCSAA
jgi:PAS domain S-box-containing protein